MALKEFIEKITFLENQLNLSELQVDDFNPWPYMRLLILNKYKAKEAGTGEIAIEKKYKSKSIITRIKFLGKSFLMYISNPVKNKEVDILYFTRQSENQDIINNELFNRYSDSFKYFFSKNNKIKILEICDQEKIKGKKKYVTYIDFIIKITRIKCKLFLKIQPPDTLVYDDINLIIKKEFGFQIDAVSDLALIHLLSIKFMKILKVYTPKLVFLTVFYRTEAMAMSLACHRLGIRVVEYQHGAQNDYHAMYTHWENIPDGGYELIPDIFWMWGTIPKKRIDTWATNTTKHKALIGGNLWMTYIRKRKLAVEGLTTYYKKNKTNILISLQGDSFSPEFLLDSIKKSSNDLVWHFRDHPRLPISNDLKNKIIELSNCEIEFSSQAPLYELFKSTDIHITGFSTVAFEAQSFNIPTIFTHSNALNGYNDLINKNGLFYAANLEDFNMLLYKLLSNQVSIEPDYIVSDSVVHFDALSKLMAEI